MTGGIRCTGQTRTWTGGGDGFSWSNAANWAGGTLPGPGDDVAITNGAGVAVLISAGNISVKSIQCAKDLTLSGGSLTLTAGASQFSGAFVISNSASLTVNGAGSSLTANGAVLDADGRLYATS